MKSSIFLAANSNSYFKKKVVNKIVHELNTSKLNNLKYNIKQLIYQNYNDIDKFLKINAIKNNLNIIIFVDMPDLSLSELLEIKSMVKLFQVFGDIPEHYNSFYKYTQFIYDGLIIEEPEYKSFFDIFGSPTFDGSIFNNETAKILGKKETYKSFIPLDQRIYDFSFIGRLDRPGRKTILNSLKKYFNNIYIYDSSKGIISDQKLEEVVRNSKYLFNSTSIQPLSPYGFNNFPERLQLQRKSRILEYARYGCIIFSEILPQKVYKTFSKKIIPVIEVPRGVNYGYYCSNFLKRSDFDFDLLSKKTYESVYQTYRIKNINLFFINFLEEIDLNSKKYNEHNLSKNEKEIIHYNYFQWFFFQRFKFILNSEVKILSKLFLITRFAYKYLIHKREISYLFTIKLLVNIFLSFISKIKRVIFK